MQPRHDDDSDFYDQDLGCHSVMDPETGVYEGCGRDECEECNPPEEEEKTETDTDALDED